MTARFIGRWSPPERLLRLARFVWKRGKPGDGKGYSAKFTVGLTPRLLSGKREWDGWILTVCGIRLHYMRSYGGIFAA